MNARSAARMPHIKGIHPAAGMSWRWSVRNSAALQFMCLLCYSIFKELGQTFCLVGSFCLYFNCIIDLSEKIPSFGNVCFVFREFLY